MSKIIPKQIDIIKIRQIVTRAQFSDNIPTLNKQIIVYILCIITHI